MTEQQLSFLLASHKTISNAEVCVRIKSGEISLFFNYYKKNYIIISLFLLSWPSTQTHTMFKIMSHYRTTTTTHPIM